MTDPALLKAREMLAVAWEAAGYPAVGLRYRGGGLDGNPTMQALAAHLREVSDAWDELRKFILTKPEPDPLVEAIVALKVGRAGTTPESYAACFRTALDAAGYEIRRKA